MLGGDEDVHVAEAGVAARAGLSSLDDSYCGLREIDGDDGHAPDRLDRTAP